MIWPLPEMIMVFPKLSSVPLKCTLVNYFNKRWRKWGFVLIVRCKKVGYSTGTRHSLCFVSFCPTPGIVSAPCTFPALFIPRCVSGSSSLSLLCLWILADGWKLERRKRGEARIFLPTLSTSGIVFWPWWHPHWSQCLWTAPSWPEFHHQLWVCPTHPSPNQGVIEHPAMANLWVDSPPLIWLLSSFITW